MTRPWSKPELIDPQSSAPTTGSPLFPCISLYTLQGCHATPPFQIIAWHPKKSAVKQTSLDITKIYSLHFLDDSEVGNVCRIIDSSCETWLQATDSPWWSLDQYTLNLQIVDMFCVEVKKVILYWLNALIKCYIY